MNAAKKYKVKKQSVSPLLSIFKKAKEDHNKTEEMFDLLGWASLPAELKFAVQEDVKAYYDELHGRYSTNCAYVQRRRESVDFWVKSYLDGICSLDTAVHSVQIKPL